MDCFLRSQNQDRADTGEIRVMYVTYPINTVTCISFGRLF